MMKKLLMTLVAALFVGTAAADDRPVEYSTFPQGAKEFITKHFSKTPVVSAMLDEDGQYTAYLNNGTKVEFRNNGAWKEVDCRASAVPASIIPAKIAQYVAAHYAGVAITKIDVDYRDYEIRLASGMELKFDLQGNFLRIDD